jgi:hypothetical protein
METKLCFTKSERDRQTQMQHALYAADTSQMQTL